jgi:CBS domain-containing protein
MSGNVCSLPESCTILEAVRLMSDRSDRHIGAVLVVDEGRLKGIFSERDALARVMAEGRDPAGTTLSEVMTENPRTAIPQMSAVAALFMMRDGGFRHLPCRAS